MAEVEVIKAVDGPILRKRDSVVVMHRFSGRQYRFDIQSMSFTIMSCIVCLEHKTETQVDLYVLEKRNNFKIRCKYFGNTK